jgi:hypothetical protein
MALLLQRCTRIPSAPSSQEALTIDEIIGYFGAAKDPQASILQRVLAGAEAMGDPSLPSQEHTALMHWIDETFALFQSKFALEAEIQDAIAALKGALVKAAWQRQMGRAAVAYTELLDRVVQAVTDSLENGLSDLPALVAEVASAHDRDQQRAVKMIQRVVDTEQGRLKTLAARARAARMINGAAANQQAPVQISELLTGDWYDSAQLTLLKFGEASPQWKEVQQTTATLLRSVQPFTEGGAGSRQELFELVTQIPRSLRRWLISLQHDSEALESVISAVEEVHMQLLRQQELELVPIGRIGLPDYEERPARGAHFDTISTLRAGRWLALKIDGEWLRCQLCLNEIQSQRLLFCNRSGMKAASLSYDEFAELINAKSIRLLQVGKAFSLCLARAAGVDDTDQLEQIVDTAVP